MSVLKITFYVPLDVIILRVNNQLLNMNNNWVYNSLMSLTQEIERRSSF